MGVNLVVPIAKVELDPVPAFGFPGSDEGDIGKDALVPSIYGARRLSDRIVIGVAVNSPFGLATRYPWDSILHGAGVAGTSKLLTINVNPAISVEVMDWLTVAAGVQAQYVDVRYTRQALGPLGISRLTGDDLAFGFTAGVKVRPASGTEIGIGYRSAVDHKLRGLLKTANAGDFDVERANLNLPGMLTVGIRQSITKRLRVMAGGEWQRWSRFDTVTVEGGPADLPLRFNYEDGGFVAVGGEYDATSELTVRAGVGREISPIDDRVRTFRLPEGDGLWLSAGLSYSFNGRFALDLAYSILDSEGVPIPAAGAGSIVDANGPFSGRGDTQVHFFSAALRARLD
jgi:long-chain fatty acid transport protein